MSFTEMRRSAAGQLRDLKGTLVLVGIFAILLAGTMILFRSAFHVQMGFLTRDPGDILRQTPVDAFPFFRNGVLDPPIYMSALAYLGYLLWGATIAICLFSRALLRRGRPAGEAPAFLLTAALLSALLLLDDVLRFHEIVFPAYLHLPEWTPFAIYGILAAYLLIRFRKLILGSEFLILALSLGCLALSGFSDTLTDLFRAFSQMSGATLFEDGLKLLGLMLWLAYFARFARSRILPLIRKAGDDPRDERTADPA